ncbi:MAG: hypothetical protein WKF57_01460 [Nakamurella sp.]
MDAGVIEPGTDAYDRLIFGKPHPLGVTYGNRMASEGSHAALAAATNLLRKAMRELEGGRAEQAGVYIGKAVALPFDDFERAAPAARAATALLFDDLVDALEETTEGDSRWIGAVRATTARSEGPGKSELNHLLVDISNDYELSTAELRTVKRICADSEDAPRLVDVAADDPDLAGRVTAILEICLIFRAEISAR